MKNIIILLVFGLFLISCSNTNKSETKEKINQIITLEKDSFIYHGEKDVTIERFSMDSPYEGYLVSFISNSNKLSESMIYHLDSVITDSSVVYFSEFIINSDTLKSTEGNMYVKKLIKGVDF